MGLQCTITESQTEVLSSPVLCELSYVDLTSFVFDVIKM
jgi:hypothetical protein